MRWSGFIFVAIGVIEQLMVGFVQPGAAKGATSETVTLQIQQKENILGCIQLSVLYGRCWGPLGRMWWDTSLLMFCHRVLRNKAIKMPQINWGSRWLIYYLLPSKCPTFSPHSGWAGAEPRSFFHLFSLLPSCWHILTNPHCWCMSERLFVEDLWFSDFCAGNHGSRALSWQF